jgi:hypothetical protein
MNLLNNNQQFLDIRDFTPYFFSESLVTESDGSRTLPLVPIVAMLYLTDVHEPATCSHRVTARSDGHELCHWPSIVEEKLTDVHELATGPPRRRSRKLPLAPKAAQHDLARSRNLPLVPILAKHDLSGSHERCHWSLSWQNTMCLAVTNSGTGLYTGKS